MREIKFRGMSFTDSGFVYGVAVSPIIFTVKPEKRFSWIFAIKPMEEPQHDSGWRKVYTNTVGQYTGLEDKNGKDIYEGDIVKLDGFTPSEY